MLRPLIRALPSVIVDTEKVLREAGGSVELVVVRPHTDGNLIAPGCASKPSRSCRGARGSQAGILLSMTKIPLDDILEGLYKLRIRESEKLKTVLELCDLEIHQKKIGPDYHRLKTMVKRSIGRNLRMNNFEARNGNFETCAVVKNQGTKQRGQRILEDGWQREANGQCSKGDKCSFRHDKDKRAKMTQLNPSPNSFMQQSERKTSRTLIPRGKSQW